MKRNLSFPKNNPQLTFSCINEDTIENMCFQGVEEGCIRNEWVNTQLILLTDLRA